MIIPLDGFLCEYNFYVHHIKGKEKIYADILSRRRHEVSFVSLGVDLGSHILEAFHSDTWY